MTMAVLRLQLTGDLAWVVTATLTLKNLSTRQGLQPSLIERSFATLAYILVTES